MHACVYYCLVISNGIPTSMDYLITNFFMCIVYMISCINILVEIIFINFMCINKLVERIFINCLFHHGLPSTTVFLPL